MDWQVVCDFDGTMVDCDVTDVLLERFALPGWRDLEEAWQSGRIGSRECMEGQVALLRVSPAGLNDFVDTIALDPAFAGFLSACDEACLPVRVVSDGMDYPIRRILTRNGLGQVPVVANTLLFLPDGRYKLEFPYSAPDCRSGVCKCQVARNGKTRVLLVGDGRSDCCLAAEADLVFAKKTLLKFCVERQLPHLPCDNFQEAANLLETRNIRNSRSRSAVTALSSAV